MQEDFLHYIWKHKAFLTSSLKTTTGEVVVIKQFGAHNLNSGPDFFNAQLSINGQLWAGNVEIHVKSSDWYIHGHEKDNAYDNVILHVVWEHDTAIYRKDNTEIPTLQLKQYVDKDLLYSYKKLVQSKLWINCESNLSEVDDFVINNWLERLFVERLERKSKDISRLLQQSRNDWEAVLFKMLLKNFGLKVNGEAFLSLGNSVDYSLVRKLQNNVLDLEALLFGQAGFLQEDIQEVYFLDLKKRFQFFKQKFKLNNQGVLPIRFFRLRPSNFPTIRLSQFANLYVAEHQLFSKIMSLNAKDDFYKLFNKGVTTYWKIHYTFNSTSVNSNKILTKAFVDLLIINTIIPLKFSYAKSRGENIEDGLFELIKEVNVESNVIVKKYMQLRSLEKNALTSQALLQLKACYCEKNKCLQCAIGNSLIVKN
ncbi:DUF2851 family protein [Winogradskyella sp.]|jgi:hypothetical protein|uniref:DUF2851 family protein n=1 Tax=Winogradskyella sp. TaxID=1883156 RepID=UPI0025DCF89E|nr:DUF2851 family protein [Winogradskyella sp.]MCT4629257.1 DUF2851 family protein [Winogradskyella sp.]